MMQDSPPSAPPFSFSKRVFTALLIAALFLLVLFVLWKAAQVLLLIFGGVLLAVLLHFSSDALSRWTRLPMRWSLSVVLVLLFALLALFIWLAAPSVGEQFNALQENVRESARALTQNIRDTALGRVLADHASEMQENATSGDAEMWQRVFGLFSTTFGAISAVFIVFFVGIFFAYDPQLYVDGVLRMAPLAKRERTREVFNRIGQTLRWWLVGQLISMAFLAITTGIALRLLGVPLAFILALLTGILTFIPYLGPVIALVPIVMVAFIESPQLALYTGIVYLVIQTVESNILMPIIFHKTAHLPPALTIAGQLILGGMTGMLGFILATPLTAVAMVVTQMLYVEDVLGDKMKDPVEEAPTD